MIRFLIQAVKFTAGIWWCEGAVFALRFDAYIHTVPSIPSDIGLINNMNLEYI